ncbi:MAG: hypothetical protein H7Y10_01975 [Flavobacterium sp.]|nr:hypothetical protein [Flavobacterium sp.]
MQRATLISKNILLNGFAILFFLLISNIIFSQVGINTTTPLSTFEVNGSNGQKINTVTLPTAVGITGRIYTIKREATSTTNLTVAGTIDGVTNIILAKAGEAVTLFSNGTEWKTSNNYNSSSSSDWNITGNTGTTAGTNFIGTTDAKDLVPKQIIQKN